MTRSEAVVHDHDELWAADGLVAFAGGSGYASVREFLAEEAARR